MGIDKNIQSRAELGSTLSLANSLIMGNQEKSTRTAL
jgi:hypothetical protein